VKTAVSGGLRARSGLRSFERPYRDVWAGLRAEQDCGVLKRERQYKDVLAGAQVMN
jgi:hypothetical protein